jgi:hypothetical protein
VICPPLRERVKYDRVIWDMDNSLPCALEILPLTFECPQPACFSPLPLTCEYPHPPYLPLTHGYSPSLPFPKRDMKIQPFP